MIATRMGAYDNMFSNSNTFKVELDEWYVALPWFSDPHLFSLKQQDPSKCNQNRLSF
jgi:hypothetical protein